MDNDLVDNIVDGKGSELPEVDSAELFNRSQRLLGQDVMRRLKDARVIVFGVGGVGSWTAEALARTGVGHIDLVDADRVAVSNINRQAEANVATIGEVKVEAMRNLLLACNPGLDIHIYNMEYNSETADDFDLESYDFVVDAIDSLSAKALLILRAAACSRPVLISSMGAALKLDPTKIAVAEFWKVEGCPLGAALRHRFRKASTFPRRKFKCVYSPELLKNRGEAADTDSAMSYNKKSVNGSLCHITAIFGMTIAGLIIRQIAEG